MDHIRILKRALEITWNYRALWVFGIILALTVPNGGRGGGGGGGGGGGSSFVAPSGASGLFVPPGPNFFPGQMTALIVVLMLLAVLLAVIFTAARYVAETAAIRMVNDYEETGIKVGVGQGFRIGWSRAAFRMFLIDLIFILGAILIIAPLMFMAIAPLMAVSANNDVVGAAGTIFAVALIIMVVFLTILIVAVLSVLLQFFHRATALENLGVFASIKRGWQLVRARLGDVVIMGLILFGLGLASVIVFLPVVFVLLMLGAVVGGLPGLLVGLVSSLFLQGDAPVIAGMVVGLPLFLLVVVLPILFLSGLVQVFTTGTWTLTYREVVALSALRAETE